jgi:uncharacterized protein YndB with AHSA1/START domain
LVSEILTVTPDGRTELRIARRIAHPPARVWQAVTDPEHLNAWFPFEVEVDLQVKGAMTFRDKKAGVTLQGLVLELDPPRLFAFDWEGQVLRFELQPDSDGTLLVFSHTFDDHYGAASFAAGWDVCLVAMEDHLAGRPLRDPGDMAEEHDRLVVEFGLDEGTVEETPDGWRVRFERQLTRPNEAAWSVLVGDDQPAAGRPAPAGWVMAGMDETRITAVDEAALLEYEWRADGRPAGIVRVEFGPGTGQGGRLIVTHTGPPEAADAKGLALAGWKTRLAELAEQLRAP